MWSFFCKRKKPEPEPKTVKEEADKVRELLEEEDLMMFEEEEGEC